MKLIDKREEAFTHYWLEHGLEGEVKLGGHNQTAASAINEIIRQEVKAAFYQGWTEGCHGAALAAVKMRMNE